MMTRITNSGMRLLMHVSYIRIIHQSINTAHSIEYYPRSVPMSTVMKASF